MSSTTDLLAEAQALGVEKPKRREAIYKQILEASKSTVDPDELRDQETALVKLGELYRDQKGLAEVVTLSRSFLSSTAKAKTAKLIRNLLSLFNGIPNSQQTQIAVLNDNIEWAKREKRIFLKQSLETRLIGLQLETQQHKPALALIETLLTELRRLDDKMILTEVHLLESRVYRGIVFINLRPHRCKLDLLPPQLQAALDLQSGILHAEDKDYTTAYSYFYETFENLSSQDDPLRLGRSTGGRQLPLVNQLALKYAQLRDVESMRAVARAHQTRDLAAFEQTLRDYREELSSDPTIRSHLAALYDTLLEQNLLRIVEPYSVVEIEYVAQQVRQGRQDVEAKLSQMILDKVFHGVLDQGRGCLLVFDEAETDDTYGAAIDTLGEVSKVVDSLYAKSVKIA
ncbi:PCI domain-containing protein [Russula brevipes]|nr:PCI domain-containing protein [Russula brevipes]